jgi:hypothetical protein
MAMRSMLFTPLLYAATFTKHYMISGNLALAHEYASFMTGTKKLVLENASSDQI